MSSKTTLPAHPLPGDSWEFPTSLPGLLVRLTVHDDDTPAESDCYTPDEMESFRSGDRWLVGIVASVVANGVTIQDRAASLWGIDAGFAFDSSEYLSEVSGELAHECRPEDTLEDFLSGFNV